MRVAICAEKFSNAERSLPMTSTASKTDSSSSDAHFAIAPDGRKSHSYRTYDVKYRTAGYQAWEDWMTAHSIPLKQVPFSGWAARDIRRNTVSVLLFDWNPDVDLDKDDRSVVYPDKTDDGGYSASRDARFRVYTVHLDFKPLPFPEVTA